MLGALSKGISRAVNFLPSADCLATAACLEAMGVNVRRDGGLVEVEGVGLRGLREPADVLNAGNSGTTMRILLGILAGQSFFSVISGDGSLRGRPMQRVTAPLREMGARIWGRDDGRLAPLAIQGSPLRGRAYESPVASAQVKSSLLLAGLFADGTTTVIEPALSRDHTERMLRYFDVGVESTTLARGRASAAVSGGVGPHAKDMVIPGDISSAAYWLAAGLLVPGAKIALVDVGINPTRIGVLEVLEKMGAGVGIADQKVFGEEPVATLLVENSQVKATTIEGDIIPRLIDELPVIAVLATQAEGVTVVRDAAELRVKESDRIECLVTELRKMGADIEGAPDGFTIRGPVSLQGAVVDSHGDHRLAMALAIAGLIAEGETVIQGAECVSVSYPNFEAVLRGLTVLPSPPLRGGD